MVFQDFPSDAVHSKASSGIWDRMEFLDLDHPSCVLINAPMLSFDMQLRAYFRAVRSQP